MSVGSPVSVPHFDFPFAMTSVGAAVVEQGTFPDVLACVRAVVACPLGACPELPTFGIPDPTFQGAPPDPAALVAAVRRWESRADETALVQALDSSGADWAIALTPTITGTGQ